MLFDSIDLQEKLSIKQNTSKELLHEIHELLDAAAQNDAKVDTRLRQKVETSPVHYDSQNLEKARIFSLETITQISIKYRLRFLDSTYFKAEFPYEALHQINQFEKLHGLKIHHFKIMAPYDMFQLENINEDPLLFAQLDDNHFYLLHKWGKDLKWHRAILNYPLQSIYAFFFTTVIFAMLVACTIPFEWLNVNQDSELMFRMWLTTHFTIAFFFFFIFLGSLSNASFSDTAWNSKYYNH